MLTDTTPTSTSCSSISTATLNLRNKGLLSPAGKLHRGCVKDAYTKLSIGSIPSNYQSIIYHHQERKGFGSSQGRWKDKNDNQSGEPVDMNGVGIGTGIESSYVNSIGNTMPQNIASFSKKGYGSLLCKEKRQWIKVTASPGPGKYQLKGDLGGQRERDKQKQKQRQSQKPKHRARAPLLSRKCFTRQHRSLRRAETLQHHKETACVREFPGPGEYEVYIQRRRGEGWRSAFETKVGRQGYIPKSQTPGPGCYKVDSPHSPPVPVNKDTQQTHTLASTPTPTPTSMNLALLTKPKYEVPGPGSYDPTLPTFKPLYQRIKISSNFMVSPTSVQPSHPVLPNPPYSPNPCTYDIKGEFDDREQHKQLIDWSCFMSQSKRIAFGGAQGRLGPNLNTVALADIKKNFHFNIKGNWL